jgi:hypothetical protein
MAAEAPSAPDLIEPLVGYRSWMYELLPDGVRLHSLASSRDAYPWTGASRRWVTASCIAVPDDVEHAAPQEGCTCGFYSWKKQACLGDLRSCLSADGDLSVGMVHGRVELAGKVIEHKGGYRAEQARIAELIAAPDDARGTILVGSLLHLPVVAPIPADRDDECSDSWN